MRRRFKRWMCENSLIICESDIRNTYIRKIGSFSKKSSIRVIHSSFHESFGSKAVSNFHKVLKNRRKTALTPVSNPHQRERGKRRRKNFRWIIDEYFGAENDSNTTRHIESYELGIYRRWVMNIGIAFFRYRLSQDIRYRYWTHIAPGIAISSHF